MIEGIISYLKNNSELSGYIINEETKRSRELFLIENKLDMNRGTFITEYKVTVFKDFENEKGKFKGSASFVTSPGDTLEEFKKKTEDAIFSAGFVKNKWYDLPVNEDSNFEELKVAPQIEKLNSNFDELMKAVYKEYPYTSKVNSCEFFVEEGYRRIITSKGTDVKYPFSLFQFELVTESNEGVEPVEIFELHTLPTLSVERVSKITERQLMETEGRSKAKRIKTLNNMRVILTGTAVDELLYFYPQQASAKLVYQQISKVKLNERFQSEDAKEPINIMMNPYLESSTYRKPVDMEGKKLEKFNLFENGTPVNLVADSRFSHYLGVKNTGSVTPMEVKPGEVSMEEYKKGDYIEIITFSSFIMDWATGDFGGEFRLAKMKKGDEITYITGGAISENIFKAQNTFRFTKETKEGNLAVTPLAIILEDVTVTGSDNQ